MKAFVLSCAVLAALAVAVFLSGARVGTAVDSLLAAADGAEPAAIREEWEREKPFVLLIVHKYEADRVDSALSSLEAAERSGDRGIAEDALVRLTDALKAVRRFAGPPWNG